LRFRNVAPKGRHRQDSPSIRDDLAIDYARPRVENNDSRNRFRIQDPLDF
jgi:hypothetical protein